MRIKFNVTGMTCAACSARVEKVTKAVPGVRKVEVNLLGGTMMVEAESEEQRLWCIHSRRKEKQRTGKDGRK